MQRVMGDFSRYSLLCLALMAVATACTQQDPIPTNHSAPPDSLDTANNVYCGKAEVLSVEDSGGRSFGDFELRNDANYLWVTYTPHGFKLLGLSLFVGDERETPKGSDGKHAPAQYPIQFPDWNQEVPWSARIPLEQLNPCIFAAAQFRIGVGTGEMVAELKSGSEDTVRPGMHYCIQPCMGSSDCDLTDPTHAPRTIPQSEWNQAGSENLQQLLHLHFQKLYPRGLAMGCDFTVTFPSADEVLKHLPMTGEAMALESVEKAEDLDHIDNRLLGELLALELAMKLDAKLPDFSPGNVPLATLQLNKGAFEGWTLAELLQEGKGVLGGCTSNYQPAQMVEVLQAINNNFAKGLPPGDYLRCPTM
jgi:hypothetical protein